MKFKQICLFLSVFVLACSHYARAEQQAAEALDSGYVLRANDIIRLDVYDEPDLSGAVRILKAGHASFPLIGSVKLSGLTVNAASAEIRKLYAKDYLVDPKLTLTVQEYTTDYIWVIGAVRNAGQIAIPLTGNIDLASAMATAGGLTETADTNSILLVRKSGASTTHTMSSIVSGSSGRIKMQADDRIIANQSAFVGKSVTILGRVARQGPIPFPANGQLDLITAIANVGGLTDLANPKKITVNRNGEIFTINYKEISQESGRRFFLKPRDIINVPERLF